MLFRDRYGVVHYPWSYFWLAADELPDDVSINIDGTLNMSLHCERFGYRQTKAQQGESITCLECLAKGPPEKLVF